MNENTLLKYYNHKLNKQQRGLNFLHFVLEEIRRKTNINPYDYKPLNNSEQQRRTLMGKKKRNQNEEVHNDTPQSRKKFHSKDLKKVNPLTDTQEYLFETYQHNPNKHFIFRGSAGTGKTFLASYLALKDVLEGATTGYKKIVIIRSAVQTRDMGYVPGDAMEKMQGFMKPYISIWDELFKYKKSFMNMMELGLVEFESTSFVRGVTFDNAIVIVDEAQNLNFHELDTCLTRIGEDSKLILCGDTKQNDLIKSKYDTSGFDDIGQIARQMKQHFEIIDFKHEDIVRSKFVKDYIITKEKNGF